MTSGPFTLVTFDARKQLDDRLSDLCELRSELHEHLCCNAFALTNQPKEDVFGADIVVVQEARFLLSQYDDPAGSVCETLEHVLYPLYGCGAPITGAPRGV